MPPTATTPVGAVGEPVTTPVEAVEAALVPLALVSLTVKVYEVPLVSPPTVVDVAAGLPVTVSPVQAEQAGDGVSVYPVIVPESDAPAAQLTLVCPDVLVGTPVTPVGAAGMPTTSAVEDGEAAEFPSPLAAIRVNV
jgi:hypothetical protein